MAWGVCHAEFAVPAEGPVAFRRDRVLLDADTMAGLSEHLMTLARTQPMTSPAGRRTVAQLLALAQALDPGNAASRELMAACRNGSHTPREDPAGRSQSLEKIHQLVGWLKLPEAGAGGQALAACLEDVAVASGQASAESKELGAWSGWVPEVAAYEERPKVPDVRPARPRTITEPVIPAVRLPQAAVGTLAWKKSRDKAYPVWLPEPTSLSMNCSLASDPLSESSIRIGPREEPSGNTARMIGVLLENLHGDLPLGLRIRIHCKEFSSTPEAGAALPSNAAAAVLASAAITGRAPDAFVLGRVNENGALTLPRSFWDQLLALEPGDGKRLVLPAAAAGLLPSLLAIGKAGVFTDYEVLLARDFRELLDLTAKQAPAHVAAASAKFHTIRERMGNEDVRSYVANRYVRQKLGELAQEAPYHASAAMLLLQGSGQRPTTISRLVLTAELTRACSALSWIPQTVDRDLKLWEKDQIGKVLDDYRKRLDELAGLAAKTDQDLLESARELLPPMREIDRSMRDRGEYDLQLAARLLARDGFIEPLQTLESRLEAEALKLASE